MVFSTSMSESGRNGLISLHFGKILVDSARNHIMMQKVEQLNGDLARFEVIYAGKDRL